MPDRIIPQVFRQVLPPPFVITSQQAMIFTDAISEALAELPWNELMKLYLISEGNLVISFDSDYRPFIGQTYGYNRINQRIYFNGNNDVINNIAFALEATGRDVNGGRVFINSDCACYHNGFCRQAFITFDWQSHNDPVKSIQNKHRELVIKSIDNSPLFVALMNCTS